MLINLEPIHLVYLALLCLGMLTAAGGIGRWLLKQLEKRIDERFSLLAVESQSWRQVERDLMQLRTELPMHYVRREDNNRNQTVLEAKLDVLAKKLEELTL